MAQNESSRIPFREDLLLPDFANVAIPGTTASNLKFLKKMKKVISLDVRGTNIADLRLCPKTETITTVWIKDSPLTKCPHYRLMLLIGLSSKLTKIDNVDVSPNERKQAKTLQNLAVILPQGWIITKLQPLTVKRGEETHVFVDIEDPDELESVRKLGTKPITKTDPAQPKEAKPKQSSKRSYAPVRDFSRKPKTRLSGSLEKKQLIKKIEAQNNKLDPELNETVPNHEDVITEGHSNVEMNNHDDKTHVDEVEPSNSVREHEQITEKGIDNGLEQEVVTESVLEKSEENVLDDKSEQNRVVEIINCDTDEDNDGELKEAAAEQLTDKDTTLEEPDYQEEDDDLEHVVVIEESKQQETYAKNELEQQQVVANEPVEVTIANVITEETNEEDITDEFDQAVVTDDPCTAFQEPEKEIVGDKLEDNVATEKLEHEWVNSVPEEDVICDDVEQHNAMNNEQLAEDGIVNDSEQGEVVIEEPRQDDMVDPSEQRVANMNNDPEEDLPDEPKQQDFGEGTISNESEQSLIVEDDLEQREFAEQETEVHGNQEDEYEHEDITADELEQQKEKLLVIKESEAPTPNVIAEDHVEEEPHKIIVEKPEQEEFVANNSEEDHTDVIVNESSDCDNIVTTEEIEQDQSILGEPEEVNAGEQDTAFDEPIHGCDPEGIGDEQSNENLPPEKQEGEFYPETVTDEHKQIEQEERTEGISSITEAEETTIEEKCSNKMQNENTTEVLGDPTHAPKSKPALDLEVASESDAAPDFSSFGVVLKKRRTVNRSRIPRKRKENRNSWMLPSSRHILESLSAEGEEIIRYSEESDAYKATTISTILSPTLVKDVDIVEPTPKKLDFSEFDEEPSQYEAPLLRYPGNIDFSESSVYRALAKKSDTEEICDFEEEEKKAKEYSDSDSSDENLASMLFESSRLDLSDSDKDELNETPADDILAEDAASVLRRKFKSSSPEKRPPVNTIEKVIVPLQQSEITLDELLVSDSMSESDAPPKIRKPRVRINRDKFQQTQKLSLERLRKGKFIIQDSEVESDAS